MLPVLVEITADPSLPQAIVRDHYQGTPLLFRLTASPDYPIAGADTLNLELRLVSTDPGAAPLALTALTAPTGPGPYDILFSSAQLNQSLNGRAYVDFWLVAYTLTGDQIQVQATVRLHLSAHSASPLLPSPPAPAIALSRIQADLLYATLASHTALATRVTALELVPPGSSAVTSVAGRTGAVNLTQTDIGGTALPAAVTAAPGLLSTAGGTLGTAAFASALSFVPGMRTVNGQPLSADVTIANITGSAATFTGGLAGDITGTQSATAIAAATVTGKALTGYLSAAGTVAATDTILTAINKLNGNDALKANLASPTFTGTVTAPTFSGSLTGNASGSAASFTGALTGDVTGTQSATAISAATVTGKALTGYSSAAGTVAATDTILTAINKLNGNDALKANLASPTFTGTVTAPTFSGSLTGTASSAANFTGALAGDVTGTQSATAISAATVTGKALTGFASSAGTVTAADTILSAIGKLSAATGAATVTPIQTLLDGVGALEIIPVMRHFGVVGGEKLGLWYSTDECRTFSDLYTGDLYTAPTGGVRDPSLLIRPDAWYVAYTAGSFGAVNYWGLAKSTTKGATWTFIQNTVVAESATSGAATWGPSWFFDPATGKTHIVVSIAPTGYSGYHQPYIQTATSADLTAWSAAVPLTGITDLTRSIWDMRITYAGGYYYLVTAYKISTSNYSLRIYRATAVAGPYTLYKEPAVYTGLTTGIEQCQLAYLGAGRWRLHYTRPEAYDLYIAESWDNLETWQTEVRVLDFTGVDATSGTAHNFSETVKIRSRIADPLPANPGAATSLAASALTGSTLATGVTASSLTSLGTLASLTVSGATSLASLTATGSAYYSGAVPATATGTTSPIGTYLGQLAGTPRVLWATGTVDQNMVIDNSAGTMRWITQDILRMSLTSAGLLTPASFATTGSSTWGIGATFTYGNATASAAHRTALGLGTLATLSPTGTQDATTYLRGDNTWATVAGGTGFTGTANRLIIGGATTNADGYLENTLATTGVNATVNASVLAVPAALIATNIALVLSPKGTGALIAGPAPDGVLGGNARGSSAVDLQTVRANATQVASGGEATAVGARNTASGSASTALGYLNTAASGNSTAVGSTNSIAFNVSAGTAIGAQNTLSNGNAEVAVGYLNTVSAIAGVAIGTLNSVTAGYAFAVGYETLANRYGMRAYMASKFSAVGDAQVVDFTLRCKTTSTAAVEMALDGGTTYLTIPSGKGMAFTASVFGIRSSDGVMAHFIRKGAIRNFGGATQMTELNAPYGVTSIGADANTYGCTVLIEPNDTSDYLSIKVSSPDTTIVWRWVAHIEGVEIAYGT